MMRTIGFTCPMCGVVFLLRTRFEAHREAEIPAFSARQAVKRNRAGERWLERQKEIGRMDADGGWVKNWRPGISG
jgi:hypothetical protein